MTAFTLTAEELDAMLSQLPALAQGPRVIEDLSGGLTNRNVKVTTPSGVFVARCTDLAADALGIDREQEYVNTVAAEQSGVGAPVVDYRPDLGVLLIRYIEGRTLTDESFAEPGMVRRAALACRTLHAGPRFRGDFDMVERQAAYLATALRRGYRIPADYLDHSDTFADLAKALQARDEGTVPCNNDLLAGNFVDDGTSLWLIDYEYSGNNDPCFELGNIWSECHLSLDQLEELVETYYGRPRRSRLARARLHGIASKYGWTLWGCIQAATSPVDYDFWGWAMERYEGALAEFAAPGWPRLLEDARLDD